MSDSLTVLEKVTIRLLQTNIFYASLLSQMRKIEATGELAKQIPTEAVAIKNGRIEFYYNPKFLETLTVDEAVGVLEHELKHVVLGHLTRMRDEYRENSQLANICQDMNANRGIPKLPKGACTVETISQSYNKGGKKVNLKDDDTSENYYAELSKHADKMSVETDKDGNMELVIKDGNGKEISRTKITVCSGKDIPQDSQDVPELAKEVIRQAIKEAVDQTNKQQGHLPAGLESVINDWLKPPVIPWTQILRNWIVNRFKSGKKSSWKRPNRRFGEGQKGHLPKRIPAITVYFDTSGSMSDEDLQAGVVELRGIQQCYGSTITVLEGDTEIQKEYKLNKYTKIDLNFKGRGGTNFHCIFEYIKEKRIATDVLVIMTDMEADFPKDIPQYPVIWVSTSHIDKAPFGVVLNIQKHPLKEKP